VYTPREATKVAQDALRPTIFWVSTRSAGRRRMSPTPRRGRKSKTGRRNIQESKKERVSQCTKKGLFFKETKKKENSDCKSKKTDSCQQKSKTFVWTESKRKNP
jgi:hypothetical protein